MQMISKVGVFAIFGNLLFCLYLCTEISNNRARVGNWKFNFQTSIFYVKRIISLYPRQCGR